MKIAYFISLHNKPNVFMSLIQAIYSTRHIYLLHVDAKADAEVSRMVHQLSIMNENVKLLPSRSVGWACWSMVQVELDAISSLLQMDQDWQYYINLSGQDMPLASQRQIEQVLDQAGRQNYVSVYGGPLTLEERGADSRYFIEDCGRTFFSSDRREPWESYFVSDCKPYNGSQWKIVTRDFCEYSVSSSLSYDLIDYFKYTYLPDERFFQTLIMNSSFKESHVNANFRYLRMKQDIMNEVVRPEILTMDNLTDMFNSDALFARKFDDEVDATVIDLLMQVATK